MNKLRKVAETIRDHAEEYHFDDGLGVGIGIDLYNELVDALDDECIYPASERVAGHNAAPPNQKLLENALFQAQNAAIDLAKQVENLEAQLAGHKLGCGFGPPFKFTRYVDGKEMAEGVLIEREMTLEAAIKKAVSMCPQRQNTVLVYVPPTGVVEMVGFDQWLAGQHGDPSEIGFLQALKVAYEAGQDSLVSSQKSKRQWRGLTTKEKSRILDSIPCPEPWRWSVGEYAMQVQEASEAELREKNT